MLLLQSTYSKYNIFLLQVTKIVIMLLPKLYILNMHICTYVITIVTSNNLNKVAGHINDFDGITGIIATKISIIQPDN